MESEWTIGDLYDEISERLALARTKALMGEREVALGIYQGASLDYTRFKQILSDYPGYHALEHAFQVTLNALATEQGRSVAEPVGSEKKGRAPRGTRKTSKAA